jgi:hypothetical protein
MRLKSSTLGWFALQIPIFVFFLFLAYVIADKTGEAPNIGYALAGGVLFAFSLTFALSFLIDKYRLLFVRWRAWRAGGLRSQIDQPSSESDRLPAAHRSVDQLSKPLGRFRIGQ